MLAYKTITEIQIAGLEIPFYQLSIVAGVAVGSVVGFRMAKELGLKLSVLFDFFVIGMSAGFLGAHLFAVILYHPNELVKRPEVLLDVFNGLSSVGGFLGATAALLFTNRKARTAPLAYYDVLCFGLCIGFVFGRLGCTMTHDHPGIRTEFFLALAYPGGARHDLGFYEMLLLLPLVFWQTRFLRRRHQPGSLLAWTCILYGAVRFLLDFLRAWPGDGPGGAGDERYLWLTPAQYACLFFVAAGCWLLRRIRQGAAATRG